MWFHFKLLLLSQNYDTTWHLNTSHDVFRVVLLFWNNRTVQKQGSLDRPQCRTLSTSSTIWFLFPVILISWDTEWNYFRIWIIWASINIRVLIETVVSGSKTFPNTWKYFSLLNNAWNLNAKKLRILVSHSQSLRLYNINYKILIEIESYIKDRREAYIDLVCRRLRFSNTESGGHSRSNLT